MADSGKQVQVTLTKSLLGRPEKQKKVVQALGLKKTNHSVVHYDTPIIRGMIRKISHLVTAEVV
jgi:large subunit ribosomal protein L30